MADLPVAVSVDWLVGSVVDGSHGGGHVGGQDRGVHGVVGHGVSAEPEISGGGSQDSGDTEEGLKILILLSVLLVVRAG